MDDSEIQPGPRAHAGRCANCDAVLGHDQRYCLQCGTRRGPLPATVDETLRELRAQDLPVLPAAEPGDDPESPEAAPPRPLTLSLPTPRVASLAVMAMLAFGVVAGSLTGPGGIDALARTFVVAVAPPPAAAPAPTTDSGGGGSGGGSGSGAPVTQQTITVTSPAPASPAAPAAPVVASSGGSGTGPGSGGGSGSAQVTLPPIRHVFMIMLSDQGYNQSFAVAAGHPYLGKTLRAQGELLPDYYGVAPSSLATGIALISGQGPTNQTAADCPSYTPVSPGGAGPNGQVLGDGCVYPASTPTLPDELVANGYSWKAYLQGSAQAPTGQPTTCRHPAPGATDANSTPQTGDPYVTWSNPFVYFASITASPLCAKSDVDLSSLATDLKQSATTPNVSYIAPDPCDNGSDQPCAPGQPAGLAASDAFLKTVVPEIEKSPAYRADGMIVITFDQAPQSGATADSSSCCDQPAFPNLSGWAAPGPTTTTTSSTTTTSTSTTDTTSSTTDTAASSTPTDTTTTPTTTSGTTTSGTTTTGATTAPCPTTGTSTTSSTTPTTSSTPTTSTTPQTTSSTTPTTTATTPCAGATPPGGGQVGALLISRYVQPNSSDVASTFNHFSLLKTIEDLFSIKHLGYTTDAALPELDSSTFNAVTAG